VSLASLLPVRLGLFDRSHRQPKHRASDEVTRLQHKLAGAELLMAGYRIQLDDLHRDHAETIARIDERHGEIVRGLEQQIEDLERRLDTRVLAENVVTKTQEIPIPPDLQARFAAGRAVTLEHSPQAVPPPNLPPWAAEDRTAIHFPQARP
jgi:hypothetical protein